MRLTQLLISLSRDHCDGRNPRISAGRTIRELQNLPSHESVRAMEMKELIPETVWPNDTPMISVSKSTQVSGSIAERKLDGCRGARTWEARIRNPLVVAVSSQQRGSQTGGRCDARFIVRTTCAEHKLQYLRSNSCARSSDDEDLLEGTDTRDDADDSERRTE